MGQLAKFHNFPPQFTPFIGRTQELAEIIQLLTDPACRLLTLVGMGGAGKTRLAIQAATEIQQNSADGVYFVPLQSVSSGDFLAQAIADAVGLSLSGQQAPHEQLFNKLRGREMLLLLDNFEQLLSVGGAKFLSQLLQAAPALNLLVTSREVLNLREEWLYPIKGLSFPEDISSSNFEAYDAVRLFVEQARRVHPDFSLTEEQPGVNRICQLVEGRPLALELAASWTRMLSCDTIAAEIQHNLNFLVTRFRDVPERHRSMQAVFEQSWQHLTEEQQAIFKRLSVFRGGFGRQAAEQVAEAALPLLSVLVDKSLLRREAEGRYQIHELLRQYAEEQLQESSEETVRVQDRHCAYYTDFLSERDKAMNGGRQQEASTEIQAELEDIRMAWQVAVDQIKVEELQKAADALYLFYQFQGRYREGAAMFGKAVGALAEPVPDKKNRIVLAELLVHLGWLQIRLGQLSEAQKVLEQSRAIYNRFDITPPPRGMATDPLIPLGILAALVGNYPQAVKLGEEAQQLAEKRADEGNLMFALYVLTSGLLAQGLYQAARVAAQKAYLIAKMRCNRWFMAYCLNDLGHVARLLAEYQTAQHYYQAAYRLKQEFDDPEGMALALNHLGYLALLQNEPSEAKRLYQQSLALYRQIGDRGGLAASLNGLGMAACVLEEYHEARQTLSQSLQITREIHLIPLMLAVLTSVADLLLRTGQQERGEKLLALILDHPAGDAETQNRAQQLLLQYQGELSSAVRPPGVAPGDALENITASLQVELATQQKGAEHLKQKIEVDNPPIAPTSQGSEPPILADPLTARELEVLNLIAAGLPNREIAETLIIAIGTVKAHTTNIYNKLGVNNRAQAVLKAVELKLINPHN